jgi:hypothetical protein
MPSLPEIEAAESLACAVEQATPPVLAEVEAELFPPAGRLGIRIGSDLAAIIRGGLAPEVLVELWNVLRPQDIEVWFEPESRTIHFNEEVLEPVD